jgi:hypothetical protein
VPTDGVLPHYFDEQAEKLADIASQREALLEKRLAIFQPTYPMAEMQTEAQPNFVIGITTDPANDSFIWIGFSFDSKAVALANVDVPEDIEAMLHAGEYEQVYNAGFNILTFASKDQIELKTLLDEAYNKHLATYFPDAMSSRQ